MLFRSSSPSLLRPLGKRLATSPQPNLSVLFSHRRIASERPRTSCQHPTSIGHMSGSRSSPLWCGQVRHATGRTLTYDTLTHVSSCRRDPTSYDYHLGRTGKASLCLRRRNNTIHLRHRRGYPQTAIHCRMLYHGRWLLPVTCRRAMVTTLRKVRLKICAISIWVSGRL